MGRNFASSPDHHFAAQRATIFTPNFQDSMLHEMGMEKNLHQSQIVINTEESVEVQEQEKRELNKSEIEEEETEAEGEGEGEDNEGEEEGEGEAGVKGEEEEGEEEEEEEEEVAGDGSNKYDVNERMDLVGNDGNEEDLKLEDFPMVETREEEVVVEIDIDMDSKHNKKNIANVLSPTHTIGRSLVSL